MDAQVSSTQPDSSPALSSAPRILIVDDNYMRAKGMELNLQDRGYVVVRCSNAEDAARELQGSKFDFAVIDGDIGDGRADHGSKSASLIKNHIGNTPYGRITGSIESIPGDLHGEFCEEWPATAVTKVQEKCPISPATTEQASLPGVHTFMVRELPQPERGSTFPKLEGIDAPKTPSEPPTN